MNCLRSILILVNNLNAVQIPDLIPVDTVALPVAEQL